LQKHTQWSKVLLLTVFTLEIVASAFAAMYIALLITIHFSVIKSIVMMLAGIMGFALGTLVFWRFSVKFSRWRSAFKR
jgi:predicted permease